MPMMTITNVHINQLFGLWCQKHQGSDLFPGHSEWYGNESNTVYLHIVYATHYPTLTTSLPIKVIYTHSRASVRDTLPYLLLSVACSCGLPRWKILHKKMPSSRCHQAGDRTANLQERNITYTSQYRQHTGPNSQCSYHRPVELGQ